MQHYDRDLFVFLFVILTCVAIGASLQTVKAPVLLVRQQTEEWKGWMQVWLRDLSAWSCQAMPMTMVVHAAGSLMGCEIWWHAGRDVPSIAVCHADGTSKPVLQILFLFYHYFAAAEVYNAIRLFIAAYVWMTGFGNFSYYYKTNDFSVGRCVDMLTSLMHHASMTA